MTLFTIVKKLREFEEMFQQIIALLARIDASLTILAGRTGTGLSADDTQKTIDALTSFALRAEQIAGKALADLQSVSIPAVILGGQPATGTLAMNAPSTTDTVVNLLSSDPSALNVPPTVIIPAGQTAVGFQVTTANPPIDVTVVITARNKITVTASTTVTHQ